MFRTGLILTVGILVVLRAAPGSKYVLESTARLLSTTKRPLMFTYSDGSEEKVESLKVWKQRWFAAGWEPVELTLEHAKLHKEYDSVLEILPRGGGLRALHWLSVAQAGGGWFSDHDVFPLHDFTREVLPNGGTLTVWENVVPSLVSGSAEEFARGAQMLAETVQGDSKHSDILALLQISRNSPFGSSFLKERKVISGSRAMDRNATTCFEGKRAVHFTDYQVEDIQSVISWLDNWSNSKCSDLHKSVAASLMSMPTKSENKQLSHSSAFLDQQRSSLVNEDNLVRQAGQHRNTQSSLVDINDLRQPGQLQAAQNQQYSSTSMLRPAPQVLQYQDTSAATPEGQYQNTKETPLEIAQKRQIPFNYHATMVTQERLNRAAQHETLLQQHGTTMTTEDQLLYLQTKLGETEEGAGYLTNSATSQVSPEEQVRMLRKRLFPAVHGNLEWTELLRAASMDENLIHQLAKGERRTASVPSGGVHANDDSGTQKLQQDGN